MPIFDTIGWIGMIAFGTWYAVMLVRRLWREHRAAPPKPPLTDAHFNLLREMDRKCEMHIATDEHYALLLAADLQERGLAHCRPTRGWYATDKGGDALERRYHEGIQNSIAAARVARP